MALEHLSTYAVLAYTKAFTDVPSTHWAARTLEVLAAKHIINGTSDHASRQMVLQLVLSSHRCWCAH
ncbi:S-layer homology domain-containing protein [Paenibacillus septentrionalis]|uniref:hypothetical protein n=1 Tax=Paenibacillus septentrionalis TaxID=429342 RepID=UPI0036D2A095